jgi:hypothetical protein
MRAGLVHYAAHPQFQPTERRSWKMRGRNDPCACGSGRKYKHCCLKIHDSADFAWRQLRAAEGRFVPELFDLALDECDALVPAALDEFFLWDGVPEDYDLTEEFTSFFLPWFVYEFIDDPDDPERIDGAPDVSMASLYLQRHDDELSSIERAFLEAASTSPLSFYAVTRVERGREIALHDILTGADVVVREQTASQTVHPGELLFTRVITLDSVSIMSGCAPLVIPPRWHHTVLDLRERFGGGSGRLLSRDDVRELDIELRDLYFEIDDALWNPQPPEIRNTDGDPLVFTTLTYRLRCSPSVAFDRLETLAQRTERDAAPLLIGPVTGDDGPLQKISIPWTRKAKGRRKDLDHTTLGTLDIDGDRLEVHVNSERRAGRIEREIAKRLGDEAVLEQRTAESAEDLLERPRPEPRDAIARAEEERLMQQPEVQAHLREMGERHWEEWLDSRLPALGNRTPREAARTDEGRERLDALFAEFAWTVQRSPNAMWPDVPALRAKLGL